MVIHNIPYICFGTIYDATQIQVHEFQDLIKEK